MTTYGEEKNLGKALSVGGGVSVAIGIGLTMFLDSKGIRGMSNGVAFILIILGALAFARGLWVLMFRVSIILDGDWIALTRRNREIIKKRIVDIHRHDWKYFNNNFDNPLLDAFGIIFMRTGPYLHLDGIYASACDGSFMTDMSYLNKRTTPIAHGFGVNGARNGTLFFEGVDYFVFMVADRIVISDAAHPRGQPIQQITLTLNYSMPPEIILSVLKYDDVGNVFSEKQELLSNRGSIIVDGGVLFIERLL